MTAVRLHNGTEEFGPLVITTQMNLKRLWDDQAIAAFEVIEKAKNPHHEMFGDSAEVAERYGLLLSGVMHNSIRNIVLSAVEGEGLDLCLRDPRVSTSLSA